MTASWAWSQRIERVVRELDREAPGGDQAVPFIVTLPPGPRSGRPWIRRLLVLAFSALLPGLTIAQTTPASVKDETV